MQQKVGRTEAAAAQALAAASDMAATARAATHERERVMGEVSQAQADAARIAEGARLEIDALKRQAAEEKATALKGAASRAMADLEAVRQQMELQKTEALEAASAELMSAVGVLLQVVPRNGSRPMAHHASLPITHRPLCAPDSRGRASARYIALHRVTPGYMRLHAGGRASARYIALHRVTSGYMRLHAGGRASARGKGRSDRVDETRPLLRRAAASLPRDRAVRLREHGQL